jgi:hypothetical protein
MNNYSENAEYAWLKELSIAVTKLPDFKDEKEKADLEREQKDRTSSQKSTNKEDLQFPIFTPERIATYQNRKIEDFVWSGFMGVLDDHACDLAEELVEDVDPNQLFSTDSEIWDYNNIPLDTNFEGFQNPNFEPFSITQTNSTFLNETKDMFSSLSENEHEKESREITEIPSLFQDDNNEIEYSKFSPEPIRDDSLEICVLPQVENDEENTNEDDDTKSVDFAEEINDDNESVDFNEFEISEEEEKEEEELFEFCYDGDNEEDDHFVQNKKRMLEEKEESSSKKLKNDLSTKRAEYNLAIQKGLNILKENSEKHKSNLIEIIKKGAFNKKQLEDLRNYINEEITE